MTVRELIVELIKCNLDDEIRIEAEGCKCVDDDVFYDEGLHIVKVSTSYAGRLRGRWCVLKLGDG